MFCKRCGHEVEEMQGFCEKCGERIVTQPISVNPMRAEQVSGSRQVLAINYKKYFGLNAKGSISGVNITTAVLCFINVLVSLGFSSDMWYFPVWYIGIAVVDVILFITMGILMLVMKRWIFPLIISCWFVLGKGILIACNMSLPVFGFSLIWWANMLAFALAIVNAMNLYRLEKQYKTSAQMY